MFRSTCVLFVLVSAANAQGPLRFEIKRFEKRLRQCVVTADYPEVISAATPEARNRINAGILRGLLRAQPGQEPVFRSLDAYAASFGTNCDAPPEPGSGRELFEHKHVTIFRYTPPVLSFRVETEGDAGGAHPYGTTFFANFDAKTGKPIRIEDLVRNSELPALTSLFEAKLRKKHGLTPAESLGDLFHFPENRFRLNDNFGIGEDELVFYFNSYEISAGAMGPTTLEEPYFHHLVKLLKINPSR